MDNPIEEKENKKALRVFGIESVIIIVLIIVIIAILSYLKVFSLSGIFQNIPGISKPTPTFSPEAKAYFESQRKRQMQEIEQKKPNPNLPKDISIVSEIPSVSASIADKQGLINLLNSWGVYGRTYDASVYANGNMAGKPLEDIVIHVTDKPQKENRVSGKNQDDIYSSSYAELTPGKMDITVQVEPSALKFESQTLYQIVTILTKMTNPADGTKETIDARQSLIEERFSPFRNASPKYFNFNS